MVNGQWSMVNSESVSGLTNQIRRTTKVQERHIFCEFGLNATAEVNIFFGGKPQVNGEWLMVNGERASGLTNQIRRTTKVQERHIFCEFGLNATVEVNVFFRDKPKPSW